MYTQYIVTDDLKLIDAKEIGIFKAINDLVNKSARESDNDDEYIDVDELCARLHCAKQTVYNKKRSGVWVEGVHFIKPSGGKLLFKWPAIKAWAEDQQTVSTRRNPSSSKLSIENTQSESHTTSTPSPCAPNKDYVNI